MAKDKKQTEKTKTVKEAVYVALVSIGGIGRVYGAGETLKPKRINGGVETLENLYKAGLVTKDGKKA